MQKTINKSRLVAYIKLLKSAEYDLVVAFLESPIYNRRDDVVRLFRLLWEAYPTFELPLTRQILSAKLYKTTRETLTTKQDNKVRNLMSRLVGLLEEYLVFTKQQKLPTRKKKLLVDALMERKNHKLALQKLAIIQREWQSGNIQNAAYYYDGYLLDEAEFFLNILTGQRSKKTTVKPIVDSLQSYALINLFQYFCAGANIERTTKQKTVFELLPYLKDYLVQNMEEQPAILQTYYHILHMLLEEEGPYHFKVALDLVTVNVGRFSFVDRRHIYSFLLNFCSGQIRKGQSSYREYRYGIYKECLAQELWVTNSYLPAHHYVLHVSNMLHLQKYEETAVFVKEATLVLPPKYSSNVPLLCQAMSSFYQGKMEECHDFLLEIDKLDDYLFVIFQKILMIQLFLEKRNYSVTLSSIHSLQAYLRPARKKIISNTVEEGFKNFAGLALRLLNYRENKDYDARSPDILAKLHKDVLASPNLYEREWLITATSGVDPQSMI